MTNLGIFKKILIVFLAIIIFAGLFLFIMGLWGGQKKQPTTPTPIPVPSDFTKDYSQFNKIEPGKSNLKDVISINGEPLSVSVSGNITTLHYSTPSHAEENIVVLENGIVKYALENVFGDYRGTYQGYVRTHGLPNLHLFNSNGDPFEWFIFLKLGVGIENSAGGITKILYFAPQPKESFMKNIAGEIGLSENLPAGSTDAY